MSAELSEVYAMMILVHSYGIYHTLGTKAVLRVDRARVGVPERLKSGLQTCLAFPVHSLPTQLDLLVLMI